MSKIVEDVLKHPFATVLVLSTIGTITANIISAANGNGTKPIIEMKVVKPKSE